MYSLVMIRKETRLVAVTFTIKYCNSGTCISKRGRKGLRRVLYQMALTTVAVNPEIRELYHYLKTRAENPLKKMQALVVISKKLLTLIFTLAKKKQYYDASKVFGEVRRNQLAAA